MFACFFKTFENILAVSERVIACQSTHRPPSGRVRACHLGNPENEQNARSTAAFFGPMPLVVL